MSSCEPESKAEHFLWNILRNYYNRRDNVELRLELIECSKVVISLAIGQVEGPKGT